MIEQIYYLAPLFLITAIVYSMIGQGGGSSYLALLALFGIPYQNLPSTALACNIIATLGVAYHFTKAGHFNTKLILPFVITSIPAAFIGGSIAVPEMVFEILLIITLTITALKTFFWKKSEKGIKKPSTKEAYLVGSLIGIGIGLLGGIIGIGGGIFLMPIILFLRWGNAKEAAMAGGLFTLVNSISGLTAHGIKGEIDWNLLIPLLFVVILGSQIGARLGAKKLSSNAIQKIFAVVLLVVAIRLAIKII